MQIKSRMEKLEQAVIDLHEISRIIDCNMEHLKKVSKDIRFIADELASLIKRDGSK